MIQSNVSADFTFFASSLFKSRNILKSPEKKSMILIGRPGYNNDDVIISRRLALKVADHWHHTYTIVGWRLRSLIGRFPEKPRNYPKRNFNRWKPFSYEFVIAADSHIQTFIEVKTSGSTSGRKIYFRLETNREKSTSGGGLKMKTIPLATVLLLYLGCHLFSLRKFLLRWLSSRGLANGFTLANVLSGEHQPNPTFLLVSRKTHDFIFKIHGLHADSDPEKIQKISENFLIWAGVEIRKKSEKKKFWTLEAHSTCPYSKWSHAIHIIYDSILWVIWIGDSLLMTQNLS